MLLIIGLDGATWDLLTPWMEQGWLPNLRALRDSGTHGPLTATMPPATFPSWATFMTGVNPGRHGIFDFTRREFGEYRVRFVNGTFRKAPTVWQMLSEAGQRVCVLGLPGTYPPEPVNGIMVSGFDTPVTTRADASFVYPAEIAPLVEALGGFPFADFQEFRIGADWHREALAKLQRGIETKVRLASELIGRERWDCVMLLFGESDTVAHHFWQFHDRRSPRHDMALAEQFGDAIRNIYAALDAAIGHLRRLLPDADVLVASDHGFGGTGTKAVHANRWLAQNGWLTFAGGATGSRVAAQVKRRALEWLPASVQTRLFRWNGALLANRVESHARFAGIDWAQTRAFSEELNYFPSLWLNLRGREAQGTVDERDYDAVCAELCASCETLRDPQHGGPVVRRAWRRDELYSGPWVQYAPDIILELNEDDGYSYLWLPSVGTSDGASVRQLGPQECVGGKLAGMGGSHRRTGVFLAAGPSVPRAGWLEGVEMADMAPTILDICGIGKGENFDGETVRSIVSGRDYARVTASDRPLVERVYGAREEAEIAARLADLGYLE